MKKLKMKISGYDSNTMSVLVSFSSDETLHDDPEKYEAVSYQPFSMWPDIDDVEELKKRIAISGIYHAESIFRNEKIFEDETKISKLKEFVGETTEYDVDELLKNI